MKTKKSSSKKEKVQSDYRQTSFINDSDESLRGRSSSSISRGNHPNEKDNDSTYEKNNFKEETDKGIVIAFARSVSFGGVEFFYSIKLASDFDLWPELARQWEASKEAHKKGARLVGKTWNG